MSRRPPRNIGPQVDAPVPAPAAAPIEVASAHWRKCVPKVIAERYEIHDFRHAASILRSEFPQHLDEVCEALGVFYFTDTEVRSPGGSESIFPKRIAELLRPKGWIEKRLTSKWVYVDPDTGKEVVHSSDTHKVDYCKGRVALDLEWNSKDQTFDRDLFAFKTFNEIGMVSVGVLVTRSQVLEGYFATLGPSLGKDGKAVDRDGNPNKPTSDKFGQSTTHMGKLLPRIRAGRGGGCPLLVFGITTEVRRG